MPPSASPRSAGGPREADGRVDDDGVRADVEATLHRVVADVLGLPRQAVRGIEATAGDITQRVREPCDLVTSIVRLAWRGLTGGHTASTAPAPTAAPAGPDATDEIDITRSREAAELAVEDYESLAASQVVARLDRLSRRELRAVQTFESSHRGRRTVLGRIEQLLDAP